LDEKQKLAAWRLFLKPQGYPQGEMRLKFEVIKDYSY
jgi:hypothetical protein